MLVIKTFTFCRALQRKGHLDYGNIHSMWLGFNSVGPPFGVASGPVIMQWHMYHVTLFNFGSSLQFTKTGKHKSPVKDADRGTT
jgi:hypothetical protein